MDKDSRRHLNAMEVCNGISPYCLPVINNFVTPVPPSTKRKDRPVKMNTSGTLRGRRLCPTTASDVSEETTPLLRSSVPQSRVCVNMVYLGKTVHLSNDMPDMRDEVKVFQQHCGGENLCVYKGKLREGESFQFISRRHRGFPFSLTFFLNGLQVERLSSCCEFKHRKSSRLGGRHGHFAIAGVEGASPCYKCIIAVGLDKKPVPPPRRLKEDAFKVGRVPRLKVEDTETTKEDTPSRSECEPSPRRDPETIKEDIAPDDHKVRDDYEEDFEADDEGPAEEEKKSPSPTGDKRGIEKDKSESEDSDKEDDIKSRSGSSCSGSDRKESAAEEVKEAKAEEEATCEEVQDEATAPSQEPHPAEAEADQAHVAESAEAKDSEIQDSAGQSTEIEIGDTPVPSGNENTPTSDTQGQADNKQEEPERGEYGPMQEEHPAE